LTDQLFGNRPSRSLKKELEMQRAMLTVATVMVVVLLSAATKEPQVYRNEEFGIMLPVPYGALLCPTPDDEHDHGPTVLLGTNVVKKNACSDMAHSRSIDIFAGYNAADATKKLQDYFKSECTTETVKTRCRPAPSNLQIDRLPSMSGRMNLSDGWIDIIVVTQAGKPDPDFDASVPSVNYDLRLHTTTKHLKDDLPIFRKVLETVKLSPAT
jgi:hypothetical protein